MEQSEQFDQVLDLGKRLVDELGLDKSVDTLGRWMTHHIAHLIADAESSSGQDSKMAADRCRAAVLDLWKHLNASPGSVNVFESIPAIVKTMKALDPDNGHHFYFVDAQRAAESETLPTEVSKWLDLARGIDHSARDLIVMSLKRAAQAAEEKDAGWIESAEAAFPGEYPSVNIIRIVAGHKAEGDETGEISAQLQKLEDRQKRLKAFAHFAFERLEEIQLEIEELRSVDDAEAR